MDCSYFENWKKDNGFGAALPEFGEWTDKGILAVAESSLKKDWDSDDGWILDGIIVPHKLGTNCETNTISYKEGKRLWDESNPKNQ